jgi:hypothetical protein
MSPNCARALKGAWRDSLMSLLGHFRQIDPLPTLSACPLRSDRVRTFAPQRFDAVCQCRHWETMAYFAAVAAFSINAATSRACERKIAWLPGSSMTCDWARFAMNRSRSGLIIRSCVGITA